MYKPSSSAKKRPLDSKKSLNTNATNEKSSEKKYKVKQTPSVNFKQFKVNNCQNQMQIDHEIAKCLDALGKRQLKYLRKTMKLSNLFESNQAIQDVKSDRNIPQQIGQSQIRQKKPSSDLKNTKRISNPKNSDEIEQQINQEFEEIVDQTEGKKVTEQYESDKIDHYIGNKSQDPSKKIQHIIPRPISALINRNDEINIDRNYIKPEPKCQQTKVSRPFDKKSFRKDSREKQRLQQKIKDNYCLKQEIQVNAKGVRNEDQQQETLQEQQKKQIDKIVQRITRLPPMKISQLGKILERMQRGESNCIQEPYLLNREEINMGSRVTSKANSRIGSARSARGKKGGEKASVIQGSFNRKPMKDSQSRVGIQTDQIGQQIQVLHKQQQNQEYIQPQTKSFIIQSVDNSRAAQLVRDQKQTQQKPKRQQIQGKGLQKQRNISVSSTGFGVRKVNPLYQSNAQKLDKLQNQLKQDFSNTKMLKIGKKKNQVPVIYIIKLTILGNRGHPSIVGLTSIEVFNDKGQKLLISRQNIKSPSNQKIMSLFNDKNKTIDEANMMSVVMSNNQFQIILAIQLNDGQIIGGLRIWNYNKSALQSNKEAEIIRVQINQHKVWQGVIKKGSYNQYQDYSTQIIIDKNFKFPSASEVETLNDYSTAQMPNIFIKHNFNGKDTDDKQSAHWLEKTLVEEKLKQLKNQQYQFQQKNKSVKIINVPIRNTHLGNEKETFIIPKIQQKFNSQLIQSQRHHKVVRKQTFDIKVQPQVRKSSVRRGNTINQQMDIFASYSNVKDKSPVRNKKDAQPKPSSQQILKQIEQRQNKQFQELISPLKQKKTVISPEKKQKIPIQAVKKSNHQRIDEWDTDFMDDSMFREPQKKPLKQKQTKKDQQYLNISRNQKNCKQAQTQNNKANLNDLIDQLNDMMGDPGIDISDQIKIPELPNGKILELTVLSNWGDPNFIGINGIQCFGKDGSNFMPVKFECNGQTQNQSVLKNLFSGCYFTTDQSSQWKIKKNGKNILKIQMYDNIDLSLIRIWNYNGHRVNSNIGIKKCIIKLDGRPIFKGQVRKASGSSQDTHKSCQLILFTSNPMVIKKIGQKDWLTAIRRKQKQEKKMFRDTINNFQRPKTRNQNHESNSQKVFDNKQKAGGIKLPKRNCNQYDPPLFPEGYSVKFILHSTWGDRHFVGLNGIQIYNQDGVNVLRDSNSFTLSATPASVSSLPGYEKDERVCQNLANSVNNSSLDKNIWLAPLQSDIDRIERDQPNIILIQFKKPVKISAINIYNYSKTPQRGVREIQIQIDYALAYRGYLRAVGQSSAPHTTFNFTRDPTILQQVNYAGYHEDNLQQQVGLVNQNQVIKRAGIALNSSEQRPLTGQQFFV